MKIYTKQSLRDFQFWSGAKDFASILTDEQFDQVEAILENLYPDGITDTQVNDLFSFEEKTIREWLNLPTEEQKEVKEEINRWEKQDPVYVEWVLNNYFMPDSINDCNQWEEILELILDADIRAEYEDYCQELEKE